MDKPTQTQIAKLHPTIREEVTKIVQECDLALTGRAKVRITQGLRTFAEQDALYAQGRTKPGKIITKAKAGQSVHNFGFAIDICLIIDNKIASWETAKDWDNDQVADWYECVKIFAKNGYEWGGNWKIFKDMPHFDKKGFNNWRKLSKYKLDKNGYILI
jgi:peptidoglycan LD-endopeptidase CwlK